MYLGEFGTTSIKRWDDEVTSNVKKGVSSILVVSNYWKPIITYVQQIEVSFPGYLHYLFRHEIKIKGPKAGFGEITLTMN